VGTGLAASVVAAVILGHRFRSASAEQVSASAVETTGAPGMFDFGVYGVGPTGWVTGSASAMAFSSALVWGCPQPLALSGCPEALVVMS